MAENVGAEIDGMEFSTHALSERPDLAARIGRVAASWALLEATLGGMLGVLMNADYRSAVALLGRFGTTTAKEQALREVAKAMLSAEEFAPFQALLKEFRLVADQRNAVVHGLWGIRRDEPDAIFWLKPDQITRLLVVAGAQSPDEVSTLIDQIKSDMVRYTAADFDGLIQQIDKLIRSYMSEVVAKLHLKQNKS